MELESLKCPVCLEVMCDPVMLPLCGHSLCRACLACITPLPPCCPVCRTEHHGPSPHKLPTNFSIAYLTSYSQKVEEKISACKNSSTIEETPSAPSFSSVEANYQEISLRIDKNLTEEPLIEPCYLQLHNTNSLELSHEKEIDIIPTPSCIHTLQLLLITFIIMSFLFTYGWMIFVWTFNVTERDYTYYEKLYLLIFGCFGLVKFLHQVFRFFKGNPSNFEISLFFHYFIFDIVWILVGVFFDVKFEVLLQAVIPSAIIIGFSISVSALSVTSLPFSPEMKASSGCAKLAGYVFLGLSISGFLGCFLAMIIIGSIDFSGSEQIYLIIAGVCGFQTTLHGSYRLMNGESFKYENYIFLLYLIIHSTWFLIGLSSIIPTSLLIFWLSNAPSLTIIVITVLISSQPLTSSLLYCCANTYSAIVF